MRLAFAVIFLVLLAALCVCTVLAAHSKKAIGKYVAHLTGCTLPPITGNLILLLAANSNVAMFGFYLFFLGMDIMIYSVLRFSYAYCEIKPPKHIRRIPDIIIILDALQYAFNPLTGFTFSIKAEMVEGFRYFRIVPFIGQQIHWIVIFGIFTAVIFIFVYKGIKTPKINAEKYWIILFAMLVAVVLKTYDIFSKAPLDFSMMAFGAFGILVYYFSLHYRPMKLLDKMLSGMASEMPDALFFFDKSGTCVWTNEPGRKLLGGARNDYESVKDNLTFLFGDIDFDKTGWSKKLTLGTGDETQYTRLEMRSVNDEYGKNTGSYLSVRDITEEQNEIKLEMYRSTHDSLTDLYTKEYLYESIEKRLKNDKKTDYMIGYMEISNYKVINDVFGKRFGDLTVSRTADFIREGARGKSLAGRLSEDSFGILIDKEDFSGKPVEEKISTFKVSDKDLEHRVIFHYGIYDISEGEDIDVPLFFDSARLATTRIADPYQTQLVYYDDKMRNEIIHDQLISSQLQDAINTKQIRPFLQPIVDEKGLLSGAEALVRWIHPDEGLMPPGKFIPVFERSGQIVDVDKHMWRSACEILKDWQERGFTQFISVNISPKDFYFLDVAEELKNLVEEYKIDPKQLRIEITETVMMDEAEERFKVIEDLRRYGFIIEMDDFGSGFSSLNLLKDMPVDVLKIDMQFLRDSERNLKAGFIIKNIIRMSDDLGIDTLTEGVETAAQFEKLYAMGCKLYQGYYFSKPVPVEDFEKQWFD